MVVFFFSFVNLLNKSFLGEKNPPAVFAKVFRGFVKCMIYFTFMIFHFQSSWHNEIKKISEDGLETAPQK